MVADLHLHSIASDGDLDPLELVARAAACGITRLAITDHDTLAAYRWGDGAVFGAASRLALDLLVGIEMDTDLDGREVHLLGFGIDLGAPRLRDHLAVVRDARRERARRELDLVNRLLGPGALDADSIFLPGRDTLMRPHFIRPLVAQGRFGSYREGRDWFHAQVATGAAVLKPELIEAIEMIHQAGGWAVLAHPGYHRAEGRDLLDRLKELRRAGLDGVEVDYPYESNSPETFDPAAAHRFRTELRSAAEALGLRATRGSDAHSVADFARIYG